MNENVRKDFSFTSITRQRMACRLMVSTHLHQWDGGRYTHHTSQWVDTSRRQNASLVAPPFVRRVRHLLLDVVYTREARAPPTWSACHVSTIPVYRKSRQLFSLTSARVCLLKWPWQSKPTDACSPLPGDHLKLRSKVAYTVLEELSRVKLRICVPASVVVAIGSPPVFPALSHTFALQPAERKHE